MGFPQNECLRRNGQKSPRLSTRGLGNPKTSLCLLLSVTREPLIQPGLELKGYRCRLWTGAGNTGSLFLSYHHVEQALRTASGTE